MEGTVVGKVWGWTRRLFARHNVQIEHLFARRGHFCSLHEHRFRYNLFYVLSGQLLVRTHKDGLDDETVLRPGESTIVAPGNRHQFEALEDTHALEVYWVELDPSDIQRYTQGGKPDPLHMDPEGSGPEEDRGPSDR